MKLKIEKLKIKNCERGQALIMMVILFTFIPLGFIAGSVGLASKEMSISQKFLESKKSHLLAESGIEDVVYRIKRGKSVDLMETIITSDGRVDIVTSDVMGNKEIIAIGDVVNKLRKTKTTLTQGVGFDFFYGAQIGAGGLDLSGNSIINGNVFSNGNIIGSSNSVINGDALAVGTVSTPDPTVSGTISEGADFIALPPFDDVYWKSEANINNDPIVGGYNISGTDTLGPRKIEGDLTSNSNANLTVTGPIYVTGNFEIGSNVDVYLDESFGSSGTIILVDGIITIGSGSSFHPTSSDPKGYIFLVSLASGIAIDLNSNSETGALHAVNGTISVGSNANVVSLIGYRVELESNATLDYDFGLINGSFSSGPGGAWNITDWREVE